MSQQASQQPERCTILAFDSGDTTGFAVLKDGKLACGEFYRWSRVAELIEKVNPTVVVAEDFRLYRWLALQQSWSQLYTCRVLGVIEYLCEQRGVRLVLQSASQGKSITLKPIKGVASKHALDATRHAIYLASQQGYAESVSKFQSERGKDDHPWPRDRLEPEKKP